MTTRTDEIPAPTSTGHGVTAEEWEKLAPLRDLLRSELGDELAAAVSRAADAFEDEAAEELVDVERIGELAGAAAGARRPKLDPVKVTLVEEVGRRVTTWSAVCPTHGRFPLDVASKTAAIVVGGRHIEAEHFGNGRLVVRRRRRR